jgi:hypothetical protein
VAAMSAAAVPDINEEMLAALTRDADNALR